MIDSRKVTVHMLKNPQTVVLANATITVTKQKTDPALTSFNDSGSQTTKFFEAISDDPLLRTIYFLQREIYFDLDKKFPMGELLPIILDPNYDIVDRLTQVYEEEQKNLKQNFDDLSKEMKEVFSTTNYQILDTVLTDKEVVASFSKRSPERIKALEKSFEKHKDDSSEFLADYLESIFEHTNQLQQLRSIMSYV